LWKCRNAEEYNTLDLVKEYSKEKEKENVLLYFFEMQEKGHNVLFQPSCNFDFGH
jgi:hypothetical protein